MNVRTLTASAALLFTTPVLVGAGSPMAQMRPAPVPSLRSTGTLVVQTSISGTPLTVGGNVALYHKGTLYRLDVLSLGIPGTSGDLSALAASFIGQGGVSAVYDSGSGALTAWSNANRTYYTATPANASSAPATAPSAAASPSDPLAALGSVASALHDVQSATIQLVGHAPVNGHPATNLDLQMKRQLPGKPLENYHAQLALADDLGEFPLQIVLQSTPATPSAIGGTAKLDLTSIQADNPDDAMFRTPDGYTRVNSLGALLGRGLPGS
jgi:hypothetical protein